MKADKAVLQAWKKRAKLKAEGDKLFAEGDKLFAEGSKLKAESDKLKAESFNLFAEGDLVFVNAAIKAYGKNVEINWTDGSCKVPGKRNHE